MSNQWREQPTPANWPWIAGAAFTLSVWLLTLWALAMGWGM